MRLKTSNGGGRRGWKSLVWGLGFGVSFRKKINRFETAPTASIHYTTHFDFIYLCENQTVFYYTKTSRQFFTKAAELMGISHLMGNVSKCQ